MTARRYATLGAMVLAIGSAASVFVAGQARAAWNPPRTPFGQPDLQGVWLSKSATPLERPKALEGRPFLTDEEVADLKQRAARLFNDRADFAAGDSVFLAALANLDHFESPTATVSNGQSIVREFDNRTSLIVDPPDGHVPARTPAGQQRTAARARAPAGPEDLGNDRRCITFGVPRVGGNYGAGIFSYYQIFQSPKYVVLTTEFIHEARIIPVDGSGHLSENLRLWDGDSRGRWDGNTLVVDTTNFSPNSYFMGSAANLHLVERLTRVADDTINYEITLDDPTTWTRPWTAVVRLKHTDSQIYEVACHEGNSVTLLGLLGAARADERAAVGRP